MSARVPGTAGQRWMAVAAVVVLASVVAAFLVMDPPARQRAERLDQMRIAHLQVLADRVDAHVRAHGRPPERIAVVAGGPGPSVSDPVTGRPYELEVLEPLRYRLCATFATESEVADVVSHDEWRHPAGRHCFDRVVRDQRDKPYRPPRPQ